MRKRRRTSKASTLNDAGTAIGNLIPKAMPVDVTPNVERPLTPRELAAFLKVSPATIRKRVNEIPHFRIGNRIRFMPSDVLAFYRKK